MRIIIIFTQCAIFFAMVAFPRQATTYYVDNQHSSANDANPGTLVSPWKTIQHATQTLVAGDTVFIRDGLYTENLYLDNAGNATDGLIVLAAYPGEKPVIDGSGLDNISNGLVLDKSYFVLTGLEIRNWPGNAIWIENASHFEIVDCEVHETTYGIGVGDGCHDFVFNRVVVYHFDLYGFDVTSSSQNPSYNGTFNDCLSHTCRDPEQNVDGFALGHGIQQNFVLNRCTTYNVYDGFDISSQKSFLNQCLAFNCSNGAYKLWQDQVFLVNCIGYDCSVSIVELDWDEQPGLVTLTNCTFFNSQSFTIWIENKADTLHMTNCIVAGGDNIGLAFEQMGVGNYRGDYNLFQNDNANRMVAVAYTDEFDLEQMKSGAWTTYSGQDTHSIIVEKSDDIFMNGGTNDLHLHDNSPALDVGTDQNAPVQDYDGNSRPHGAGYDIGAYEFGYATDVGLKNEPFFISKAFSLYQNFPNPFNPITHITFSISKGEKVSLRIYNLNGQIIRTLINEQKSPGVYSMSWDGRDENGQEVGSGLYYYQLSADDFVRTRKMLLVR